MLLSHGKLQATAFTSVMLPQLPSLNSLGAFMCLWLYAMPCFNPCKRFALSVALQKHFV
jgi:hypothetical protein